MINFGSIAGTAGIWRTDAGPGGQGALQKTESLAGPNAGFFGMLLALFTRPVDAALPGVPGPDGEVPYGGQEPPAPGEHASNRDVIVQSEEGSESGAASAAAAAPGKVMPAVATDIATGEPLLPDVQVTAGAVSGPAASVDIAAADPVETRPGDAAGDSAALQPGTAEPDGVLLSRPEIRYTGNLQDSIEWTTRLRPAPGKAVANMQPHAATIQQGPAAQPASAPRS